MLTCLALTDYLASNMLTIGGIFIIILTGTRLTTARPLPPQNETTETTRTTFVDKILQSEYFTSYALYSGGVSTALMLLLFLQETEALFASANICIAEYYGLYLLVIGALLISAGKIYSARAQLERVSSDALIATTTVMLCIQAYYLPANIWAVTILLECQGMALLLLLSTDNILPKNTLHTTGQALKQQMNTTISNAVVMQFGVGFVGAALLLTSGSLFISANGASHGQDISHLTLLHQQVQYTNTWHISLIVVLVLSLLLKTGAFPMHFGKPELYNVLRLTNVFIYAVPYSVAIAFIVILLLGLLILGAPAAAKGIIWGTVLSSTYILMPLLFALTEIKAFLAYTSGLHVIYMYAATIIDRIVTAAATFYNITYGLAALTMFAALLNFRRASIKYLTDLQIYSHLPTKVFGISTAVATMAGIPPLLGFGAKFNVLFSLGATGDYILTIHMLTISMIYMYFYVAMYRFTGATNFKVAMGRLLLLASLTTSLLGVTTTAMHSTGLGTTVDLSNGALLFAQNIYAYA